MFDFTGNDQASPAPPALPLSPSPEPNLPGNMLPQSGVDTWRDQPPPSNRALIERLQAWRGAGAFAPALAHAQPATGVIPLTLSAADLIDRLQDLGLLRMALVHDHGGMITVGRVSGARHRKHRSTVTSHPIDTRLRHHQWGMVYAVGGRVPGIYVTDGDGQLCLAWLLQHGSRSRAFAALCADGTVGSGDILPVKSRKKRASAKGDAVPPELVDRLLSQWRAMIDTHQFSPMLSRLGLGASQAYALAEGVFTRPIPSSALPDLVAALTAQQIPAMVFMENAAGITIHTGIPSYQASAPPAVIGQLESGEHLWRQSAIDQLWLVTRPSREGDVVSVEAFDDRGNPVVKVFAQRSWQCPEDPRWAPLLAEVTGVQPCHIGRSR